MSANLGSAIYVSSSVLHTNNYSSKLSWCSCISLIIVFYHFAFSFLIVFVGRKQCGNKECQVLQLHHSVQGVHNLIYLIRYSPLLQRCFIPCCGNERRTTLTMSEEFDRSSVSHLHRTICVPSLRT